MSTNSRKVSTSLYRAATMDFGSMPFCVELDFTHDAV
jgi:hypothetical protein